MKEDEVLVSFPNLGPYNLKIDMVKKWEITDLKTIGDTNFFKYGGSLLSMSVEDYNKVFKNE